MSEESPPNGRPGAGEVDLWGVTHRGWVREENQDHFLVGTLTDQDLEVIGTSLDEPPHVDRGVDPPVFLAMVAGMLAAPPLRRRLDAMTAAPA